MRREVIIAIVVGGLAIALAAAIFSSDSWLIERAKDTQEVKAIFDIHQQPSILVERGEDTGVVYKISTTQLEGQSYDPNNNCLYLKVISGFLGYPVSVWTGSTRYELGDEGLIEFLERGGGCVTTLINAIPESAVLNKTKEFQEVKTFLKRYPSATISLQKLVNFEVAYGITESKVASEQWDKPGVTESGVYLYMQVDRHLNLESMWISCHVASGNGADAYDIYEDLQAYLEKEENCWDDDSLTFQNPPPGFQN